MIHELFVRIMIVACSSSAVDILFLGMLAYIGLNGFIVLVKCIELNGDAWISGL